MKRLFLLLAFVSVFLICSMSFIPSAQSSMVKNSFIEKNNVFKSLFEIFEDSNLNNLNLKSFLIIWFLITLIPMFLFYLNLYPYSTNIFEIIALYISLLIETLIFVMPSVVLFIIIFKYLIIGMI